MRKKLRRAAYSFVLVCAIVFAATRYEEAAAARVPYASPQRPEITKKDIKAAPAPQQQQPEATPQPVQSVSNEQGTQDKAAPVIDISRASEGKVTASYTGGGSNKLVIQCGKQRTQYNVKGDGKKYTVTLMFGAGDYTITYMVKVGKTNKYAVGAAATCSYAGAGIIDQETATPGQQQATQQINADDARFLTVTNEINWNTSQSAIKKASSLADSENATKDKVKKIYSFIIQNITYDYDVYGKLPSGYLPDLEHTYVTRKGICYDFSALFGGMLRSQGIPAKLCKGSATLVSGYHAWNSVLIDGKWYVVDTSSDSIYYHSNVAPKMFKSSSDYSATKES